MRGKKFSRHWLMLAFLMGETNGRRLEEIAHEVKCSVQTVRRDLAMLQAAGFPIERKQVNRHTMWHLTKEFRNLPPVPFGPLEAAALAMAEKRLRTAGDEFFGELVSEMLGKLKQGRTAQISRVVKRLEESFVGLGGMAEKGGVEEIWLQEIMRAIRGCLKLDVDFAEGKRTLRKQRLAPLRLWFAEQKSFVQVYCYGRRAIRTFELGDFRRLRVMRDKFVPEWELDPVGRTEKVRKASIGKPEPVELEFQTGMETQLRERPLHGTQAVIRRNGHLIARLTVPVTEPLVQELMRFGAGVRVVQPERLGKLLASHHRAAVAAFEDRVKAREDLEVPLPLIFD